MNYVQTTQGCSSSENGAWDSLICDINNFEICRVIQQVESHPTGRFFRIVSLKWSNSS